MTRKIKGNAAAAGKMVIRPLVASDKTDAMMLASSTPEFDEGDIITFKDCLYAYLEGDKTYYFDCAHDGSLRGFACYGWDSIAKGVMEVYWIVVAPESRRKGIARRLQESMESEARRRGSRVIFAETESVEAYANTRKFYEGCGYKETARVKDFYDKGNDKVIYRKDA